jgi:hypothetical protein
VELGFSEESVFLVKFINHLKSNNLVEFNIFFFGFYHRGPPYQIQRQSPLNQLTIPYSMIPTMQVPIFNTNSNKRQNKERYIKCKNDQKYLK